MWDPALVINGLVVSTPPQEEYTTVTFMTAALHHTQCVVHACWYNALHVLHSMECVDYQSYHCSTHPGCDELCITTPQMEYSTNPQMVDTHFVVLSPRSLAHVANDYAWRVMCCGHHSTMVHTVPLVYRCCMSHAPHYVVHDHTLQ